MPDDNELVPVARFGDPFQADMARFALNGEGIDCWCFDQNQAAHPVGMLIPTRVMVRQADFDRARAVLQDKELL